MKAIRPPKTPRGLAFTPAYALDPLARLIPVGLVTPERDGVVSPSIAQQTVDCFANLGRRLAAIGDDAHAVKMTLLMTDVREVWASNAEFDRYFTGARQNPAKTLLEVPQCSVVGARIEMDVWAVAAPDGSVPEPLSDVRVLHSATGEVGQGIETEIRDCLAQLEDKLASAGARREDVVKIAVLLSDMSVWPACREVVDVFLETRSVPVVPMAVTKVDQAGGRVELSVWVNGPAEADRSGPGPAALAISGSAAIPMYLGGEASAIYDYQPEADIRAQTEVCLSNYENILREAGASWDDIVETTWHLTDRREWDAVRSLVEERFGRPVPNPTVLEVPKFVLPGVRIEVDMWGVLPAGDGR